MISSKKDINKSYLPHLFDPFRQKIAVRYAQHELRKLLPSLRKASLWKLIDKQIEEWSEKLLFRDFWNGIHGISIGFRLKSLVPWITSLNMQWAEKDVAVDELWFGGKFGPIASLGVSEASLEVRESLFLPKHRKLLEQTRKNLVEKSVESAPRDDFPIFVVRKEEKLRVIDGNRRLLQAIVNQKNTIRAFAGEPIAEPPLYEHWVPTSLLVDLVFWYKRQVQIGRKTTNAVARIIAELIRDSSAGRLEFAQRSIHRDNEIHMRLLGAVAKILDSWGILLDDPKKNE